jgi:hypothetical protein
MIALVSDPDLDRAIAVRIALAAARHGQGWQLTADQETAAIADLQRAADGRTDLLGEHAGVALGFGESRPDAARYRQIASLCLAAGADPASMDQWRTIARHRATITATIRRNRTSRNS